MKNVRVLTIGTTLALLSACGASAASKATVPSRDQLAAQIVEAGGVSEATASCAADALYENLSEEDLALVVTGEEPSADAKTRFTDAVLDCLSGTVVTETPETDAAPTTEAATTTEPTTTTTKTTTKTTAVATTAAPITAAPTTAAPTTTAMPTTTAAGADPLSTSSQYAVTAEATSAYGETDWAASQATGAPNSSGCADDVNAWASLSSDGKDSLTLTYAKPVIPSAVRISMNYNPNQIVSVEVVDTDGAATSIYASAPVAADCPSLFEIPVTGVVDPVSTVRVTVDQSILGLGWTEIDAVELVGVTQ